MTDAAKLTRRHLRIGWWSLLFWLTVGIALESMHGFKVGWYLAVGNETRRLLFTLAHAHGTAIALVHLGFAFTVAHCFAPGGASGVVARTARIASPCLTTAAILLPMGFLLGGVVVYGGSDPGPGIFLVPVGAIALLVGVLAAAIAVSSVDAPAIPATKTDEPRDVDVD
jgi:hypothetical protein